MQSNHLMARLGVALALTGIGMAAGAQTPPHTGSFGSAHSGMATGKMNGMAHPGLGSIVGNKKTHVYHLAGDKSTLPTEKNRAYFQSEAQAMAAGYHRAGVKKTLPAPSKMTGHSLSPGAMAHPGMKH